MRATKKMVWKVHVPGLLKEIGNHNPTMGVLGKPLTILGHLLSDVGQRAAELNDPKLNALMCRLAIYSIADPDSPEYDERRVHDILAEQGWA